MPKSTGAERPISFIKHSLVHDAPGSLACGELAFSFASMTLFIGSPSGEPIVLLRVPEGQHEVKDSDQGG